MDKVFIYKQSSYNGDEIKKVVEKIFAESGFSEEIIYGKTAFLKVNLLRGAHPDRSVTTHPVFVRAVAEVLIDKGLKVIVGDSPAGPFTPFMLKKIYRECGLIEGLEGSGAELNYDVRSEVIRGEESLAIKDFEVISRLREVDYIINLPKLKTHTMMTYTGAVKNMFGAIVGLTKANYHFRLQSPKSFGQHLVDIVELIKPSFNLMDGIVGMEGDGPSSGISIHSNVIMGSYNPHAMDVAALKLMGIDESLVETVKLARERSLVSEIEIIGDEVTPMNFKLPKGTPVTFLPKGLPKSVHRFMISRLKPNIVFIHSKCIKCRDCGRACPAEIIIFNKDGLPLYDKEKCISCFCCHEVCPVHAIDVQKPILSRLLRR